jgi:hypothetical protein
LPFLRDPAARALPELLTEAVLTITALIRSRFNQFSEPELQLELANVMEPLLRYSCLECHSVPLFQSIHDLLRVLLIFQSESPDLQIVRIGELASGGVFTQDEDFCDISLQFWVDFCRYELRQCHGNASIERYNEAVSEYCDPQGIAACPDIYPWRTTTSWNVGGEFVKRALIPDLAELLRRNPTAIPLVKDILRAVGGYAPEAILDGLARVENEASVQSPLLQVLCLDGLWTALSSAAGALEFLSSAADFLLALGQETETAVSELAISTLAAGIRHHGLWLSEAKVSEFLDEYMPTVTAPLSATAALLVAVVERVVTSFPDLPLPGLVEMIWRLSDDVMAHSTSPETLELILKQHEIIAPRLATDAWGMRTTQIMRVCENLAKDPTVFPDATRFTVQRGLLSILAVIFKSCGHEAATEAGLVGDLILSLIDAHVIIAPDECIRALTEIVGALQEQIQDLGPRLWGIVEQALDSSDPHLVSLVSPLIASLFTWATSDLLDVMGAVLNTMHSTFLAPQCTRELLRSLCRSVAIVLRAIPVPVEASYLEIWFLAYKQVSKVSLRVDDDIAIEDMNAMYQGIFNGLGAVIDQARDYEEFRHIPLWRVV